MVSPLTHVRLDVWKDLPMSTTHPALPKTDPPCLEANADQDPCAPLKVLRAEFDQLRGSYYHFADKMEVKLDQIVNRSNQCLFALMAICGTLIAGLVVIILKK
jgi:hypothetical protein